MESVVEFRCAQSDGSRTIDMFLSVVPAAGVDVDHVVRSVLDSVRSDRLAHDGLGPDAVLALSELEHDAADTCWRTVCLPGAYKRMASTAAHGGHSAATLFAWRPKPRRPHPRLTGTSSTVDPEPHPRLTPSHNHG